MTAAQLLGALLADPAVHELLTALIDERIASRQTAPTTLVSPQDFATARGISVSTVRSAIRDGRLPATKIGRSIRIASDAELGQAVRPAPVADSPSSRAARLVARRGGVR